MKRTLLTLSVLLLSASPALATPADRVVNFTRFVDPESPATGARYIFSLEITCVDNDGDWNGWQVTQIWIARMDGEVVEAKWGEGDPEVDTLDGLWWIEHADAEEPETAEFTSPPRIAGVATPNNPANELMDYVLEGVAWPEGVTVNQMLALGFVHPAYMRMYFCHYCPPPPAEPCDPEPEPEVDEEEEPVETDDDCIT